MLVSRVRPYNLQTLVNSLDIFKPYKKNILGSSCPYMKLFRNQNLFQNALFFTINVFYYIDRSYISTYYVFLKRNVLNLFGQFRASLIFQNMLQAALFQTRFSVRLYD